MQAKPPTPEAITATIERGRLTFEAALRAGDAAAASSVYADDATLLAPAADVLRGRSAIEGFWRTGVETGIQRVELAVLDLQQRGDIVFEVGQYAIHLTPESGEAVVDRGRYLVVHRREPDGRWRRVAEMFSPDPIPIGQDVSPG